jgi:quercetin dioxygenase-like cupin family protein
VVFTIYPENIRGWNTMTEPLKAPLKDLIEYHDGSVVSRTLIDKKEGTVTLFSLDTDQGISEHLTPYDAMVQILEGRAVITISGNDHELEEGEIIIMPANEPHALRAVERFKMLLTMIRAA